VLETVNHSLLTFTAASGLNMTALQQLPEEAVDQRVWFE
jgi:hypothetical protein